MSGITRQSIYRGPGRLTLGSTVIDNKDGISLSQEAVTADVGSDLNAFLGSLQTDQKLTVGTTPYGALSEALLAALYPAAYRTPAPGSSLFGAADVPCTIHSTAGVLVTLFSAALTTLPPLVLSAVATAFGPMEITALPANGKLPGETDALLKAAASAFSGSTAQARPPTGAKYSAAFGSLTFAETVAGFRSEFPVSTEPVPSDNAGTLDLTLAGVRPACRFQPLDQTEAALIALLGLNRARGSSTASGEDLVITGTNGLVLTLFNCAVLQGPLNWGVAALRDGELLFQASPDPDTGMIFDIAYTDPVA
jgi:hypothetical protein